MNLCEIETDYRFGVQIQEIKLSLLNINFQFSNKVFES